MQPYDPGLERELAFTDDEVRELGYKEHPKYPGYFIDDPRYPHIRVEDRYLYDHPGPDWFTKPKMERRPEAGISWDKEQLSGPDLTPVVRKPRTHTTWIPSSTRKAQLPVEDPGSEFHFREPYRMRTRGLYLCQVCHKAFALWPSERAWKPRLFGLQITLTFRTPIACTNCRIIRQRETAVIGHDDHRLFWKIVIAFWENDLPPTGPTWLPRAMRLRNRLYGAGVSVARLFRRGGRR